MQIRRKVTEEEKFKFQKGHKTPSSCPEQQRLLLGHQLTDPHMPIPTWHFGLALLF